MNKQQFPKWQTALREAQQALSHQFMLPANTAESDKTRSEARDLRQVLQNVFGIPVEPLKRNYHHADGIWFSLKFDKKVHDDGLPVFESTATSSHGHRIDNRKAAVSFTLYIGHVTPCADYPHWPEPKALVCRDVKLMYTNFARQRAELAHLIDEVEAEYEAALPRYQAWHAIEMYLPTDAEAQQDYLLQLIRRAVQKLPASESLPPKPVDMTFFDIELAANEALAELDGMLPPKVKEFDGYDAFDPLNYPDDLDDDDSDDDDDDNNSDDDDYPDDALEPLGDEATEPATEVVHA